MLCTPVVGKTADEFGLTGVGVLVGVIAVVTDAWVIEVTDAVVNRQRHCGEGSADADFHLLYTPNRNDYGRNTLLKQLGAEITWTNHTDGLLAFAYGAGWDGENALLTLSFGLGHSHSFGGAAPTVSQIN